MTTLSTMPDVVINLRTAKETVVAPTLGTAGRQRLPPDLDVIQDPLDLMEDVVPLV